MSVHVCACVCVLLVSVSVWSVYVCVCVCVRLSVLCASGGVLATSFKRDAAGGREEGGWLAIGEVWGAGVCVCVWECTFTWGCVWEWEGAEYTGKGKGKGCASACSRRELAATVSTSSKKDMPEPCALGRQRARCFAKERSNNKATKQFLLVALNLKSTSLWCRCVHLRHLKFNLVKKLNCVTIFVRDFFREFQNFCNVRETDSVIQASPKARVKAQPQPRQRCGFTLSNFSA